MDMKKNNKLRYAIAVVLYSVFACVGVYAQTHTSVSLDNHIYYILEQAEQRGLCGPFSGSRPYTQRTVLTAINETLNADSAEKKFLSSVERAILEQYRQRFSKPKSGIDVSQAGYFYETSAEKNDFPLSVNLDLSIDTEFSTGVYSAENHAYYGAEGWLNVLLNGDIGNNLSYGFLAKGGLIRQPRKQRGVYHTYYEGFQPAEPSDAEYVDRTIPTYQVMTYFPWSYRKQWDGSIYPMTDLSKFDTWPNEIAGAYALLSELTGSFIED